MAKDNPKISKPKEPTPFEKFDRLVKKIVRVPKDEASEKSRQEKRRSL